MYKIDTLSPSFFAGLIGYAVTGSGAGFWIGAAGAWLALTALILIAAAAAHDNRKSEAPRQPEFEFAE